MIMQASIQRETQPIHLQLSKVLCRCQCEIEITEIRRLRETL